MDVSLPTTAEALGQFFGAEVIGNLAARVTHLSSISDAEAGALTFVTAGKYLGSLRNRAGVTVFASRDLIRPDLDITFLVVQDPQAAFATIAQAIRERELPSGISPLASVHDSAQIAPDAYVAPFAYVGRNAILGEKCVVHPHAYVGNSVSIGSHSVIHSHVTLLDRVQIGRNVVLFPSCVIGSDGFGYLPGENGPVEMPQMGTVVIEDNVRMGAHCTVDRATLGETRIGRNVKFDDHVHIGHNCTVGANTLLCGQVAVGGSATIGANVIIGGKAGVGDHVIVEDGARIGAASIALTRVRGNETYWLTPHVPAKEALRIVRYWKKLPEIWERLRSLEQRVGKDEGSIET